MYRGIKAGLIAAPLGLVCIAARSAEASVIVHYTLAGDANEDERVDLQDFQILASNFGNHNASWAEGDFNFDSIANTADLNLLASNFGASVERAPPLTTSRFTMQFRGSSAPPPITFTEVPISAGAIADDPTLATAHCYRIGFNLPAGENFTCGGLDVQLTSGSFYNAPAGGIASTNPGTWNTPGDRQLAYDTFVTSPVWGSQFTNGFDSAPSDPIVLGDYPETSPTAISTPTEFSVAWGALASVQPGSYYVAQLTVLGTTLSQAQIIPEPTASVVLLASIFPLRPTRKRSPFLTPQ